MFQVVSVVRMISLDDMHSENLWFSWFKPSNYGEKLRCHACDGRTDERWKVEQYSGGPETAIVPGRKNSNIIFEQFASFPSLEAHCRGVLLCQRCQQLSVQLSHPSDHDREDRDADDQGFPCKCC